MTGMLLALGALPFVIGGVQNWYVLTNQDAVLPYGLISAFFLLLWGVIAFLLRGNGKRTKEIVIFLNLIAALDLLLVGVQELILGAYWRNFIGSWSQLFYLPVLNLGFRLTTWSHGMFPAYVVSFLLLVGTSFVGCKIREKLKNKIPGL